MVFGSLSAQKRQRPTSASSNSPKSIILGVQGLGEGHTNVEMTYNVVVGQGVELVPSIQYISNPDGSEDFCDATVLGLKLSLSL